MGTFLPEIALSAWMWASSFAGSPRCAFTLTRVYQNALVVAWRVGLFLTEEKIGVLSVSSLFLTHVGVCVCIRTHTHTVQMEYLDVSPGVEMRHLEGPKNPDGLNLGIHIFVYVYKVQNCIYMLRGGMGSWTEVHCRSAVQFSQALPGCLITAHHLYASLM